MPKITAVTAHSQVILLAVVMAAATTVIAVGTFGQNSFAFAGYDFLSEWGSHGIANGYFSQPDSVAVDGIGNVYVVDLGNKRIQKFSSTGEYVDKWGQGGKEPGKFYHPSGVAVDENSVYVADRDLHRIQKFDLEGNFVLEWGSKGTADDKLLFPSDVAVGPDHFVYVADTGNQRIQKFTPEGDLVLSFGSSGLKEGQFVTVSGIDVDDQGNVYVTDKGNGKIEKFDSSGNLVDSFQFTARDYVFSPTGIKVGPHGQMFTVNSNAGKILLLKQNSDDLTLDSFEQLGPISHEFSTPTDIEIGINGQLYVVDSTEQKIKVFKTPLYVEPKIITSPENQTDNEDADSYSSNNNNMSATDLSNDTKKPQIIAPFDLTVDATDFLTEVNLGEPIAQDESGIKTILNNAPKKFYPGIFNIHWIAFDNAGNSQIAYQTVTVTACGHNSSHYNTIEGATEKDDVLEGTAHADLIFGLEGNDLIYGGEGDDCIFGGDGDDIIYGNEGNDTLRANGGDDILKGQLGDDFLYGGLGSDVIDGGEDDNRCYDTDGGDGDPQNNIIRNCEP